MGHNLRQYPCWYETEVVIRISGTMHELCTETTLLSAELTTPGSVIDFDQSARIPY